MKAACRELPALQARQRVIKGLSESYSNAMDYLKRKRKAEFGDSVDVNTKMELKFDNAFAPETKRGS